ncbi:glutamate racemase [Paenibacillus sp. FSL R7-0273]|uniref:glutamate racemase n=1 Tax=Paenibacillus sp. FSL R7-0273 TaxID=1536772 RepID=UPI0004F7580D|nr:glutamate racemase [Paenibacillus sp. FSL R7-0273]AIQ47464.1 glutamate racemase [Paenibacillus sp. FSL R7-0273]OMF95974.1 glutamate racemase [Paenibacillus sp. FSL R7-0273]
MRIGFFDSGIGGITVLHQALKLLPNEDYLFYADTQNVPYGEKTKEEVKQYIFEAVQFIAGQQVKALVIACNTATSVAIEELRERYAFPILGIEPAVKPAVQKWEVHRKKVLVLATNLTLKEEKFNNLVKRLDHQDIVNCLALPGLVEFAERHQFNEELVGSYLRQELSQFDLCQYGTVVLGCTHFPYFTDVLRDLFPEGTDLISGSLGTAKNLKRILDKNELLESGSGDIVFYQSGVRVEDTGTLERYGQLLAMMDER